MVIRIIIILLTLIMIIMLTIIIMMITIILMIIVRCIAALDCASRIGLCLPPSPRTAAPSELSLPA